MIEQLRAALEAKDPVAVEALLAEDVVFSSPALFKPYAGRAATMVFLRAAMQTFADFRYVRTFQEIDSDGFVLMFAATVNGREVEGADFLSVNDDGLVDEFRVMVRPMSGLISLAEAMAPKVEGPLLALGPD